MKTMRASSAGFPCDRHLWYLVNGYEGSETDTKTKRIFEAGNIFEPKVVDWLREDGWEVIYNPGSQGAAIELTYPLNGGRLAGHFDCFISKGSMRNILADIKTMNNRAFTMWKREGSIKSKPQYVDQLHVYAGAAIQAGYTVEHLAIVGVNKNDSELYIDIFDYSPERFREICERSERIMAYKSAPEENSPREDWCCRYCEFSRLCEIAPSFIRKDAPVNESAVVTDDAEIINAMELLQEAREISHTGADMEAEAKSILDEKVRKQGITLIQGGGFELNIKERNSSRFDTTGFKKAHPEMISQFMKQSTSTFFEIARTEADNDRHDET